MKIFEKYNPATKCPICGTNKEGKAVLILKLDGESADEGRTREATQFHLDCIELVYSPKDDETNKGALIMIFEDKGDEINV